MLTDSEIISTLEMLENENLDVRTVTLGINLLDCAGQDPAKVKNKIQSKIIHFAERLVPVCDRVGRKYGIPVVNKRISVSPIAVVGTVYVLGGYPRIGAVAIRAGGKDDVTDSHVLWTSRTSSYVATPVFHDGRLYWVDDKGIAVCLNAENGQVVYEKRLPLRGRGGRAVYASPIRVADKLIVVTRHAGAVIALFLIATLGIGGHTKRRSAFAPYFQDVVTRAQAPWRHVVTTAVQLGIPVPAFSTALCYYDAYRMSRLPANLLQAQRDYFGAHTYERVDRPRGEFSHTDWTGHGGDVTARRYDA